MQLQFSKTRNPEFKDLKKQLLDCRSDGSIPEYFPSAEQYVSHIQRVTRLCKHHETYITINI